MDEAERALRAQLDETPSAHVLAALGNIAVRRDHYASAREWYERAIEVDPQFAQAHLAAAELASIARDEDAAKDHLASALLSQRYFADPSPALREHRIVLLLRDATSTVNAPLELLLDRSKVAIDKCFVDGYEERLPEDAVAVTAFGWWSGARTAIEAAVRYRPVNDPEHLVRASRAALATTLDGITLVEAVAASRVPAQTIASLELPAVVRPADTHAGRGLGLVTSRDELIEHVARFPSFEYDVARYVDYRSPDGYYRKYRVVLVGGRAYPYHLGISSRWIVHYQSSLMSEHAWMREEEDAFLRDPGSVFPNWDDSTAGLVASLGLDYVGLDVTRLADGTMLVFEADPAMLVHDEDPDGLFGYKCAPVARIREALMRRLFRD